MLCRALLFQVGMIVLHMATLEDPNELYSETNIKEELLIKRLESLKTKGYTEKLQSILGLILVIKEEKRITMEELLKSEKGAALLQREIFYYQGKLEGAQNYSGFVKIKSQEDKALVPHGLGDMFLTNGESYKGSFNNGKRDGWGIWFNGENIYNCAQWENDVNKQGQMIVKNVCMLYTTTTGEKVKGKVTWIPLSSNMITPFLYYEGDFDENGEKTMGDVYYKDGGRYRGELKNDLKHGKGVYYFPVKKEKGKKYDGDWVDDKMHGEGKLKENGKAWEVTYDKDVEITRKEWVPNVLKEKRRKKV